MRIEWTVTRPEQRRYIRVILRRTLVVVVPAILVGPLLAGPVTGDAIDWTAGLVTAGITLAVMAPVLYLFTRRAVARNYPVGSTATVEVDGADLRIAAAVGITQAPLARWQDPLVRGAGVRVKDTVSGRRCWFPRALFPDAVVGLLGTGGVVDAAQLPPLLSEDAAGQRTWTVTAQGGARLTRDRLRILVARPIMLLSWAAVCAFVVVLPLVSGDRPTLVGYLLLAVMTASTARGVQSVVVMTRRQFPDGFTAFSRYAGGRLTVSTATGTTEYVVAEFARPRTVGSVFSARVGPAFLTLPAELVPGELVAEMAGT